MFGIFDGSKKCDQRPKFLTVHKMCNRNFGPRTYFIVKRCLKHLGVGSRPTYELNFKVLLSNPDLFLVSENGKKEYKNIKVRCRLARDTDTGADTNTSFSGVAATLSRTFDTDTRFSGVANVRHGYQDFWCQKTPTLTPIFIWCRDSTLTPVSVSVSGPSLVRCHKR